MASPRPGPFIWVTWLAKVMAGDCACQWQTWFQTHHRLLQKQPPTYDQVGWKVEHTRMLSDLTEKLVAKGLDPRLEYRIELELPAHGALVCGKADCLVEQPSQVAVYDCKTGQPRAADQVQLMIYLHCLAQDSRFAGKKLHGAVLYRDSRSNIPRLPESFTSNFDYFVALLSASTPPIRTPGEDCRYCPITDIDCSARIQG